MPKFIIQIPKDGLIRIEAKEFSGPDCTRDSEALENLLGTVVEREFKPEYYAAEESALQVLEEQNGL